MLLSLLFGEILVERALEFFDLRFDRFGRRLIAKGFFLMLFFGGRHKYRNEQIEKHECTTENIEDEKRVGKGEFRRYRIDDFPPAFDGHDREHREERRAERAEVFRRDSSEEFRSEHARDIHRDEEDASHSAHSRERIGECADDLAKCRHDGYEAKCPQDPQCPQNREIAQSGNIEVRERRQEDNREVKNIPSLLEIGHLVHEELECQLPDKHEECRLVDHGEKWRERLGARRYLQSEHDRIDENNGHNAPLKRF